MAKLEKKDIISNEAAQFALFHHAFRECSSAVQEIVDDMVDIIVDDESSAEERNHAIDVLVESLLPGLTTDVREIDSYRNNSQEAVEARKSLDEEEATFADSLRDLMAAKSMTQETLAKLTGVSQPAIANMLSRKCRPQQGTVSKFASALDVDPSDLWPVV